MFECVIPQKAVLNHVLGEYTTLEENEIFITSKNAYLKTAWKLTPNYDFLKNVCICVYAYTHNTVRITPQMLTVLT